MMVLYKIRITLVVRDDAPTQRGLPHSTDVVDHALESWIAKDLEGVLEGQQYALESWRVTGYRKYKN